MQFKSLTIRIRVHPALFPTLIRGPVWGDMDKMVSVEESEQVAKWIPGAEFEILSNVKHPIEQCDSNILKEKISRFL